MKKDIPCPLPDIQSDTAAPDEREAIENARKSILEEGTVPIDEIDWD